MLTDATKRRITEDWQREFPSFAVYRPMWLLKRHGPLLVGILLELTELTDSSVAYTPTFHVHNLLTPSPVLTLSLPLRAHHGRHRIPMLVRTSFHDSDFEESVASLREAVPELSTPQIPLSGILERFRKAIREEYDRAKTRFFPAMFGDVILLTAWAGHTEHAQGCFDHAMRIPTWNRPVEVAEWRASIKSLMEPQTMTATLEAEIARHKLQHIPVFELLKDTPTGPSVTEVYESVWCTTSR